MSLNIHNPLVSVIMPTYNRAYMIENAIKSVLNQTYENIELIIVDDGSEDNTYEVVSKYFDKGDICYFKQKNKKQAEAKNVGLRLAKGVYIAFLDSDDEYLTEHISLRVELFRANPELDLIHGGIIIIGNPFVPDKYDSRKLIHLSDCYVGGTFFGKREAFLKLNGFRNLNYGEDSDLMERAINYPFRIEKVDFRTYIYNRESEDSICRLMFNETQAKILYH